MGELSSVDDEAILFDIRRSPNWVLRDQKVDWERMAGLSVMLMGIAMCALFLSGMDPSALLDPVALLIIVGVPLLCIFLGYGLYSTEREEPLRVSRDGIVIIDHRRSGRRNKRYRTVPFEKLTSVSVDRILWGTTLSFEVNFDDDQGDGNASEYERDRELDIYGFVEKLNELAPEGRLPSLEEFIDASGVETRGKGERGEYRSVVRSSAAFNAFIIVLMLMSMGMLLYMPVSFAEFYSLAGVSLIFVVSLLFYIAMCLFIIIHVDEEMDRFLEEVEWRFKLEGDSGRVPRPLLPWLFLSIRRRLPMAEVREVRKHLVLNPLTHKTMVVTVDGRAFVARLQVFKDLEGRPGFRREGRRLVNTAPAAAMRGPVARVSWAKVGILLMSPAIFHIALVLSLVT